MFKIVCVYSHIKYYLNKILNKNFIKKEKSVLPQWLIAGSLLNMIYMLFLTQR